MTCEACYLKGARDGAWAARYWAGERTIRNTIAAVNVGREMTLLVLDLIAIAAKKAMEKPFG